MKLLLVCAAVLAPGLLAPSEDLQRATLVELRSAPGRRLGEEVALTFQFRERIESWTPYLSRFEPTRWLGLSAWPDEVFTWDAESYDAPLTHLFVRRGTGLEDTLRRAAPYQRFQATAIVREHFLGEPWIELTSLTRLNEEVGEGTILHVTRARELALEGNFDLALDQYERARAAPLPPHALAAILEQELETREARDLAAANAGKKVRKISAPPVDPRKN